jgi:hypothetical protein
LLAARRARIDRDAKLGIGWAGVIPYFSELLAPNPWLAGLAMLLVGGLAAYAVGSSRES